MGEQNVHFATQVTSVSFVSSAAPDHDVSAVKSLGHPGLYARERRARVEAQILCRA
jgi:hypothetical protein